ncbi:MAG: thiamine diphosphokinase, partial [Clostridia bacterium]|nr:thiamine diphosphokinase [Clostridia bacterium]
MKAFIYTGGEIFPNNITEHPKADDLTIAADSGYSNAKTLGDSVQILVGDLDSLDRSKIEGR